MDMASPYASIDALWCRSLKGNEKEALLEYQVRVSSYWRRWSRALAPFLMQLHEVLKEEKTLRI